MKEYNLEELVALDVKSYNKYMKNLEDILVEDYKKGLKTFTYKKVPEEGLSSTFLKDEEVLLCIGEEKYTATKGNLLSVLIVFGTLNKLYNNGVDIGDLNQFIFDPSDPEDFNTALDEIYDSFILEDNIKNIIFESMSKLAKVAAKFVSGTISLRDIYMLQKENPEFKDLINFQIEDTDESFASMIDDINTNRDKLKKLLVSTDSSYRSMILSGSGFNFKQASQIFNMIGPKPDVFGNIHKHAIMTNFLNGLQSVDDFYVNADNCKKALITNFTKVKDSGLTVK